MQIHISDNQPIWPVAVTRSYIPGRNASVAATERHHSTSTTISISTAMLLGKAFTPTEVRA